MKRYGALLLGLGLLGPVQPVGAAITAGTAFVQYRVYEDGRAPVVMSWVTLSNDGAGAAEADVASIRLLDPSDAEITGLTWQENSNYYYYNCAVEPCESTGPFPNDGYYRGGASGAFPAGDYTFQVTPAGGGAVVERVVNYPEAIALPVVQSSTMTSNWQSGGLVLAWQNPDQEANWASVNRLHAVVYTAAGGALLYASVVPPDNTVTIPAALLTDMATIGDTSQLKWEVQTRAYNADADNYARGYSRRVDVAQDPDAPITISSTYLQYRVYEDDFAPADVRSWVELRNSGGRASAGDVAGFSILDPSDATVAVSSWSFWGADFMNYDCRSGTCQASGPGYYTGVAGSGISLADAGVYTLQVDPTIGGVVEGPATYEGAVALPIVRSTSMTSEWVGSDLQLSWQNPDTETNWDQVAQLKIVLYAGAGGELLYATMPVTAETVTLPASLLTSMGNLGDTSQMKWEIQTRAYNGNQNYARGYSRRLDVAENLDAPITIHSAYIQHRVYEDPAQPNRVSVWAEVRNAGGKASASDVEGFSLFDESDASIDVGSWSFQSRDFMHYNCISGTCQTPTSSYYSGVYATLTAAAAAGVYTLQVDPSVGDLVERQATYEGAVALPVVPGTSMNSAWSGDVLTLTWENPDTAANWDQVTQLKVILLAGAGGELLYATLAPAAETLTVPASLLASMGNLGDTSQMRWEIQTRAYEGDQNYARGYSRRIAVASRPGGSSADGDGGGGGGGGGCFLQLLGP